jgi:hypothetical protein
MMTARKKITVLDIGLAFGGHRTKEIQMKVRLPQAEIRLKQYN